MFITYGLPTAYPVRNVLKTSNILFGNKRTDAIVPENFDQIEQGITKEKGKITFFRLSTERPGAVPGGDLYIVKNIELSVGGMSEMLVLTDIPKKQEFKDANEQLKAAKGKGEDLSAIKTYKIYALLCTSVNDGIRDQDIDRSQVFGTHWYIGVDPEGKILWGI